MDYKAGYQAGWIEAVFALYNRTELKRKDAGQVDRAMRASFAVVSCWSEGRIVGIGRVISDGEMYASIFDVVVDPDFQKRGIGKGLMERLIASVPGTCIHLTSTFGNEPFYSRLGFRRHKTAMALYPQPSRYLYLEEEAQA